MLISKDGDKIRLTGQSEEFVLGNNEKQCWME